MRYLIAHLGGGMENLKKVWIGFVVLSLAGFALAGHYLTPGEQDGFAEECEVRDYNGPDEPVRLKVGGVMTNRPFNSFSAAAQQKITGWDADENFMSSSGLRIKVRQEEQTVKVHTYQSGSLCKGTQNDISYIVTLENRSQSLMQGVVVGYLIFYEEREGSYVNKKYCAGELNFDIASGEKKRLAQRRLR